MGNVNLPPIDSKGNRNSEEYLRYIAESLAMLQDELQNILEGRISAQNIRAESIETKNLKAGAVTAEKITVTELSAISANLGHILAGLIESVTIIGSLIQTSESSYPRVELRSDTNLFKAASTMDRLIEVIASFLNYPIFRLEDENGRASISYQPSPYTGLSLFQIYSLNGMEIESNADINFFTGLYSVVFGSWNNLRSRGSSQTLQEALNAKQNTISGYTGSFSTGTKTVTVVNGIITSVV